jgi:LPS O-antigen subunit length determinant protein (WzzB/FepE family)
MNKNSSQYSNDDTDIIVFVKLIWKRKLLIFLITIISLLIGYGYNSQLPNIYLHSLAIKLSDDNNFLKFSAISSMYDSKEMKEKNNFSNVVLNRFIQELGDYEEFILALKETKKINKTIIKLPPEKQEKELIKYVNFFKIIKSNKNVPHYIINLEWDNTDEARDILRNTINLTLNNLEKKIYKELVQSFEIKKKIRFNKDLQRLNYLSEQSLIAKELDISDKGLNLYDPHNSETYFRGYKAIDKEIEIIKNRNYPYLDFIEQEINSLINEKIDWIVFNINLINIKSLKNTKFNLLTSILLGLIFGVLCALISNALNNNRYLKKTK